MTSSARELVVLGPGLWVLSPAPAGPLRLITAGGTTDRSCKVTSAPRSLQTGAVPYFCFRGIRERRGRPFMSVLYLGFTLCARRCPHLTSLKQLELRNPATFPFSSTMSVPGQGSSDSCRASKQICGCKKGAFVAEATLPISIKVKSCKEQVEGSSAEAQSCQRSVQGQVDYWRSRDVFPGTVSKERPSQEKLRQPGLTQGPAARERLFPHLNKSSLGKRQSGPGLNSITYI